MIGRIQASRRQRQRRDVQQASTVPVLPWRLAWVPRCGSTEHWLERWIGTGSQPPLAVLAGAQNFGHGQRGRRWVSPPGGVWLSAALPWHPDPASAAALGLAVAVGLALQLEELGLAVQLKWPNDLLVEGRKLAGLLPRLRFRGGRIREARVGLGLNGRNRVPAGAIGVASALGRRSAASAVPALAARVLAALEWAVWASDRRELVRTLAERRLLIPPQGILHQGRIWQAEGLSGEGALLLRRPGERVVLTRTF